jgi:hypothetical protein
MAHFISPSLVLAASLLQPSLFGQPPATGQTAKDDQDAPWQRLLTGDDANQVAEPGTDRLGSVLGRREPLGDQHFFGRGIRPVREALGPL